MAVRMWGGTEVKGTSLGIHGMKATLFYLVVRKWYLCSNLKKGDKKYGSPDSKGRLTSAKPSGFHD